MSKPFVYENIDDVENQLNIKVPSQTGNQGKCLYTNGTSTSWVRETTENAKAFTHTFESAIEASESNPYEFTFPTGYSYTKGTHPLYVVLGGVTLIPGDYAEEDVPDGTVCSKIYIKTNIKASNVLYVIIGPTNYRATAINEIIEITGSRTNLTTNAKKSIVSAINEVNTKYRIVHNRLNPQPTELTWEDLQTYTQAGTAPDYFNIGDFFESEYNGETFRWVILGFDYDTPATGTSPYSTTLQLFTADLGNVYDAPEADYYCETALEAGTYNFSVSGTSYEFTTTQSVPVGGLLKFKNGREDFSDNKVVVYASGTSASLEECSIASGTSGTSLGGVSEVYPWNKAERSLYGNNLYSQSAVRQFLNSSADSSWFAQKNYWDLKGETISYGFKKYLEQDLLDVIGPVWKRTGIPTTDGSGYIDTKETVFLLSKTELTGELNGTIAEGAVIDVDTESTRTINGMSTEIGLNGIPRYVAYPYYQQRHSKASKVMKDSDDTIQNWFTRSAILDSASKSLKVINTGDFSETYENTTWKACCAVCIY